MSKHGLAIDEARFWTLTPVEFNALVFRYNRANGIKSPKEIEREAYLKEQFDKQMRDAYIANKKKCASKPAPRRKR